MLVKANHLTLCMLMFAAAALPAWGQAVRIESSTMGDPRIPIAVPDFVAPPELAAQAKELRDALAFDLEFTGLFVVAPPSMYPPAFRGFTSDPAQIDFQAWGATKLFYLVYAGLSMQGSSLVAECRMFDLAANSQVIGQRLATDVGNPRMIPHRFSEAIVYKIDGAPGMATSRICFSGTVASGKKEIFIADYDGHNVKQLTNFNSISIKPKFSPDGTKIAYLSYKDRYPFLYVLDLATGKSTSLSKNVGLNSAPAWHPDGRRLAMTLSKDANTEIYIKNWDGSGERRITNNPAGDTSPTFDPTGTQIAFVSDRGGQPQIYAMDIDGGNVRRLSYQGGAAYDPVWSPDGKSIAYVVEQRGSGVQIFVMGADGSSPRAITSTGGTNESPAWSPDSRNVMCCSARAGRSQLWGMTTAQPFTQFLIGVGNMTCQGPTWGPRRQ